MGLPDPEKDPHAAVGLHGQGVGEQRALAGPRHAGHDGHAVERDVDIDVLEVVRVGAHDIERLDARLRVAGFGLGHTGSSSK